MLTILASYAQEESLSANENQKRRIHKLFENGILPINKNSIYYYKPTPDGDFVILQDEAHVIRYIFHSYLSGLDVQKIPEELNPRGILIEKGTVWQPKKVRYVLYN